MRRHAREFVESNVPYVYDPGQQIISLSPNALREGIEGAEILIGNDYEFAMMADKSGLSHEDLLAACPVVVVTFGELGSRIYVDGQEIDVPAVRPTVVADPTGAGDGYRAGLMAAHLGGYPGTSLVAWAHWPRRSLWKSRAHRVINTHLLRLQNDFGRSSPSMPTGLGASALE